MAVIVSEKPWSEYTKADYTPEQWHVACLIHQHDGAPTSKGQCKLPVKTPSGSLNRNGVHAAAGALAGARGGVDASSEEKAKASKALVRYYSVLGEETPPSLRHFWMTPKGEGMDLVEDVLEHYGIRGMHWGITTKSKGRSGPQAPEAKLNPKTGLLDLTKTRGGKGFGPSDDAKTAARSLIIAKGSGTKALSNEELSGLNKRLQMEQQFAKVAPKKVGRVKRGQNFTKELLSLGATANAAIEFANSPAGQSISGVLRGKTAGGKHAAATPGVQGLIKNLRKKP